MEGYLNMVQRTVKECIHEAIKLLNVSDKIFNGKNQICELLLEASAININNSSYFNKELNNIIHDNKGNNNRYFSQLSRSHDGGYLISNSNCYIIDQIIFGERSSKGELTMTWIKLFNIVTCKLQAFNDSWLTLYNFSDVLEQLKKFDSTSMSPEQFCSILLSCGFVDITTIEELQNNINLKYKKEIV